ncbi:BlaI/MecI/CopY family transcriptional regulator [Streptomyces sp. NBC_01476]|uniref:BlaI/MecI/CopY family transcriptional regulator n=1 Tax=Streptomyces sp. NBC_01476 TaxID=2903881 RepID=UPI002E37597A|nr:BlaI/MecI/CopY family transcriptional regulator [Streptomyces sp. NBC_01476]
MAPPRRTRGSLERDILAVLAAGERPMTPAQVREALGGELAYTTVMTVLARLHAKGEAARQPSGRGYAYAAPRNSTEVTAERMQRLLDADVDRAGVLARFVGTLGAADERLLRSLLEPGGAGVPGGAGGAVGLGSGEDAGSAEDTGAGGAAEAGADGGAGGAADAGDSAPSGDAGGTGVVDG